MRRLTCVLIAMLIGTAAGDVRAQDDDPATAYIAHILAEPTFDPEGSCRVSVEGLGCALSDALLVARTEVVQWLAGPDPGKQMTIRVADHMGNPAFARFDHALVIVVFGDDWMTKATAVPVLQLADGGWATCGGFDGIEAKPLAFREDMGTRAQFVSSGRAYFVEKGLTRLQAGRVVCTRGVRAEDVYAALRAERLEWGFDDLPEVAPGFAR